MIHITDMGMFSKLEIDSILNKVSERYDKQMQDLLALDNKMEYLSEMGTIPSHTTQRDMTAKIPYAERGLCVLDRELVALKRELEMLKAEKAIRDQAGLNAAKEAKTREEISKIKAEIEALYKELHTNGSSE